VADTGKGRGHIHLSRCEAGKLRKMQKIFLEKLSVILIFTLKL